MKKCKISNKYFQLNTENCTCYIYIIGSFVYKNKLFRLRAHMLSYYKKSNHIDTSVHTTIDSKLLSYCNKITKEEFWKFIDDFRNRFSYTSFHSGVVTISEFLNYLPRRDEEM